MNLRKLSWQVVLFCVACEKLAGFEDLRGPDATEHEAGTGGDSEADAGKGGGTSLGGAAGDSADGEGGAGDVAGIGESGGNAGSGASVGSAGGAGMTGSGGGTDETGGTTGAAAGTSGGGAGVAGASGGGAGVANPSGCGELLANGSFEQGRLGWDVMTSYPNLEINVHPAIADRENDALADQGVTPHAGDFLAWVGGVPDSHREYNIFVTQPIVVAQNVTELIFQGFFLIKSEEPNDVPYDDLYVEILDREYQRVWQFGAFSNRHQGPNWFAIDPIDPRPENLELVRGRELYLGVYSRTDAEVPTHFFFDSLSLVATCD